MREILFRGKRKDNGEWAFGYYVTADGKHFIFTGETGLSQVTPAHCLMHMDFVQHEVIPETVGQYTGVRDRKGVRIFDGDILREFDGFDEYIVPVKWSDEYHGFVYDFLPSQYAPHQGIITTSLFHFSPDQYEIIGNFHGMW